MQMIKTCFSTLLIMFFAKALLASEVTVMIHGAKVDDGKIFIGLFNDPKEFPKGKQKRGQFTDSATETIRVVFADLPNGTYAIAAFQDKNSNEKLDSNFLGIPKEKYGFSGRKVFGKPHFEDSAIDINADVQITIEIK